MSGAATPRAVVVGIGPGLDAALARRFMAVGKAGLRTLALTLHKEFASTGIHVGTVTVAGQIQPGTPLAPERIAEAFWDLLSDSDGAFRAEIVSKG